MRTLDEVIDSITKQSGLEIRNVRKPEKDRFWVDRETYNDVLYYLRMYRSDMQMYADNQKYWEDELKQKIKDFGDAKDRYINRLKELEIGTLNTPLSWEELTRMEGKPVWVEVEGYYGYWTIVHWNSNIVFEEYYDWNASPEDPMKAPLASLDDTNFGTTWQAYRKER